MFHKFLAIFLAITVGTFGKPAVFALSIAELIRAYEESECEKEGEVESNVKPENDNFAGPRI